jgi:hypothetical protein
MRLANEIGRDQALAVPTDVCCDSDVAQLAQRTIERFGRVDALINNAGMGIMNNIIDAQLSDFQEMVNLNVYGAVRCTKAFLPHMLAQRSGHIVMMASIAGLVGTKNMGFYAATKHALVGLGYSTMHDLAGTGVRVAIMCPGVVITNFMQRADITKFARSTKLVSTDIDVVAAATVRALQRRAQGQVVVPLRGTVIARWIQAFPALGHAVLRLIG